MEKNKPKRFTNEFKAKVINEYLEGSYSPVPLNLTSFMFSLSILARYWTLSQSLLYESDSVE